MLNLIAMLAGILAILIIAVLILADDAGLLKDVLSAYAIAILIVGTIGGFVLIGFVLP